MNRCQPKFINWSYRNRGSIHRTQIKNTIKTNTFARKMAMLTKPQIAEGAIWSKPHHGSVQPPRNSVTIIADDAIMLEYSPMKNSANFIELYSVL